MLCLQPSYINTKIVTFMMFVELLVEAYHRFHPTSTLLYVVSTSWLQLFRTCW